MRTKKSARNVIVSTFNSILNIIISLFVQKIFLRILGESYLGLNGVFSNMLSILAVAELGIGTAIVYKMYRPIEEKNEKQIAKLMNFYRRCYHIIISVMILIILIILPFLRYIIGDTSDIKENIYLLYGLFSLDILISYLLAYKKSILYADQNEYISNLVHLGYLIFMNSLQIFFLIKTHEYLIYLIIKIACRFLENLLINFIVNRKYAYIGRNKNLELDKNEQKDIFKKIKSLFLHKLAGFVVTGTDTILISFFLGGLVTVGYYSNYSLIISAVTTVFNQVFISITSSVGNLLVTENKAKRLEVFNKIQFLNFWFFAFASICIFCIIEPFITIWIGSKYILSKFVLISLVFNFFMQGMRRTMMSFKEAAGIFYEDRYVPIIESVINLVASIIFLKIFGLAGVFLGTITSTLIVYLYSYPKIVYETLFGEKGIKYVLLIGKYTVVGTFTLVVTYCIVNIININNDYLRVLINMIICMVVPNVLFMIIYWNNCNFKYYLNIVKKIIHRK